MVKKKGWTRYRHKAIRNVAYLVLKPYCVLKYGITVDKFSDEDRQYLILYNHQTVFDQFFVGMAFKNVIYYLATEDIFSNGFVSSLIRYLVAPIPIKKQTTDVRAVMNCIRVAREGGTIALAPEGNRTYSGRTEYMNPAIAPLARKLGLPVALFRIEGGYGVQPRWSNVLRKGKMHAYVSRVIEPEQIAEMSNDELMRQIAEGLDVHEGKLTSEYYHRRSAEYLERAIYICPDCGLSRFESHGDILRCTKCGKAIQYLPTKELKGINCDFPFDFVYDWYRYQCDFINHLDVTAYTETPFYREYANWYEVIVYKNKKCIQKRVELALFGDRVVIGEKVLTFDKVTAVSVLGRNKLNIYHDDKVYQFKGNKRFNALKYVHIFYRYRNLKRENGDGEFLGL